MRRHWNRRGAAALTCILGLSLLGSCTAGSGKEQTTVAPEVDRVIESTVEDTGTVAYRDDWAITPLVSGQVVSCTFEEGDSVAEGDVLYVIDSGDLEDQIVQAQLSLSSAEASLAQAQAACEDLTVKSHASGTVTAVHVHVGDFVSAGTPIAEVVDSASLELTVPFSTTDAASIAPGAAATISFPAQAGTVTGTVERVYDAPTVLSGGREGVYVVISFQNPGAVMSGSTTTAVVGTAACMEAGTVSNATEQSIYATQSGQVLDLPIQAGTAVTVGQTVMTIKNDSLTNAVTNAALARDSAAVSLSQLQAKRPDYTISAPADGVILQRQVKQGDMAAAGSPMATLAQPDALCVKVDIDEQSIERVWVGQQASISFTADSGEARTYTGTVRRIDDTGITSGGVTDYTVELALDSTEGLRSGMNVDVTILTEQTTAALSVPSRAVQNGQVTVLRDGKEVQVPVETGLAGDGYTEILEGLTADDTVVLPG